MFVWEVSFGLSVEYKATAKRQLSWHKDAKEETTILVLC